VVSDRPAITRLSALDGLRGLACLTVFLENLHIEMGMRVSGRVVTPLGVLDAATFAGSGIGVVVFLVLSGTVLSLPFWRDLARADAAVSWRDFALKRFVRIAPPYYACLAAIAVATSVGPLDLWRHVLFINNLFEGSFYELSPQFWTIGVFVQMYVLLAVVFVGVRLATRQTGTALTLVSLTAAGAYLVHAWLAARSDTLVITHSTLAHFPHALLGVFAGCVLARASLSFPSGQRANELVWEGLLWGSLAGAVWFSANPVADALGLPHGRYTLPWLPALVAVAVAAAPRSPIGGRLLAAAPLSWLGVVSYGVYIYHVPAMKLVARLMAGAAFDQAIVKLQFALISLAVTIVVAAGSYVLLERPMRRGVAQATRHGMLT
jgi:peptidoglycan/LPS O-acetylase OafA/YrhL